jgi:threonine synthase
MTVSYVDAASGQTWPVDIPRWCGDRGQPLLLTPLPGIGRDEIERGTRSLWRYRAALPLACAEPISLGEGWTPLLERRCNGVQALLKCEWVMPTGSFKDRGASVMLSLLRAQGVRAVLEDSSGNGGAAVAAYAAAGGLEATILAPASTSPAKTLAMRACRATVELVPGNRQATSEAALARAASVFYASHAWQPFFLHGTKTLAYELWEQLGFRAPDAVIVPCGGGSNVLGCAIGFDELLRAGQITRAPRLFAAQPERCAPVVETLAAGRPVAVSAGPTIAEGTAIAAPVRLAEVVAALRASGGGAVALAEEEIAAATLELAGQGIGVEPTAAQALAAHRRLLAAGILTSAEECVLVLTGSALKATAALASLLGVAL